MAVSDWKESSIVTIWKKSAADKGNSKCIKLGLILENPQVKAGLSVRLFHNC